MHEFQRSPPRFANLPGAARLAAALDAEVGTAYVIDLDWKIVFVNEAWRTFAEANGGPTGPMIDVSVRDAIPDVLSRFYEQGFGAAVSRSERWEHAYECSSAVSLRRFRMRVVPHESLPFVAVSNDPIVEQPMEREAHPPSALYVSAAGVLTQCAHCRRMRAQLGGWHWVPAYVERAPAKVSHGLCPTCLELHYPE